MIVYQELASLSADLGFTPRTLYSVSRRTGRHYHPIQIPKGSGGYRELLVPDELLKRIQTRIYQRLLFREPVSRYAMAYRPGGSVQRNAAPHVGKPMLLKLDIDHFFDHITYPLVKEKVFPGERYSEANRILLSVLCTCRGALPQGAPTSPAISNLILREFDEKLGVWCRAGDITYTRYCDDMTFSGDFDPKPVIDYVSSKLGVLGFFLNRRKTVAARRGQRQTVTGLIVNEKLRVPSGYKRRLRQELYYCMKYGIESHLSHVGSELSPDRCIASLLGQVSYVLSAEPGNDEAARFRRWLLDERKRIHGREEDDG